MKGSGKDKIIIGGELVEAFGERAIIYQAASLVDDNKRQHTPERAVNI